MTVLVYDIARRLPASEQYELARQIRRAATSVPANIAEGHARRGRGYLNHVRIALGSIAELETHLHVAIRLGLLQSDQVQNLFAEATTLTRMLHALRKALWTRVATKAAASSACVLIVALLIL